MAVGKRRVSSGPVNFVVALESGYFGKIKSSMASDGPDLSKKSKRLLKSCPVRPRTTVIRKDDRVYTLI